MDRRVALALVVLAGCSLGSRLEAPLRGPTPEEARETYIRACASCHGDDARGDGPAAARLSIQPPDLTQLAATHGGVFPRQYVIDVVTGDRTIDSHGTRAMPVWREYFGPSGEGATAVAAVYAQRRLEMLVSYLESVQIPKRVTP